MFFFVEEMRNLFVIQGMDRVVRQTGQHIEFDPEWETAFNLVIKLQSILAAILDWCSHDQELLTRAYEVTGAALAEIQRSTPISHLNKDKKNSSPMIKISVHDLKVDCFTYDVEKDPISIHIPVVRLFVGKLKITIENFLYVFPNTFNFSFTCTFTEIYE